MCLFLLDQDKGFQGDILTLSLLVGLSPITTIKTKVCSCRRGSFGPLSFIMNELLGESLKTTESITVQHLLTLGFSDKWERTLRGIVVGCLEISRHYMHTFRILGYGTSAYLVLLGMARVIEATKSNHPRSNETSTKGKSI